MPSYTRGFDVEAATAHLSRADRKLARWMQRIGPITADPRWKKPFDPVDALARAILYDAWRLAWREGERAQAIGV